MNLVKEKLYEMKELEVSAGLVIIHDKKILLIHPTNSKWKGTFSIPKGGVNKKEKLIDAALRETKEEIGLVISKSMISNDFGIINYTDKKGRIYKEVHYFVVILKELPILDKTKYQLKEIDFAKFYSYDEAEPLIFWRFKELLKYIK